MQPKSSPTGQAPRPDEGQSFIETARRAQIIGCAIDTIAELGYRRASLAEIAKRARVSKSVISYYFTSKEELIVQVVNEVYVAVVGFMLPLLQVQVPNGTRALLRTYIESNIAFMDAHRNHFLTLVNIISGWGTDGVSSRFGGESQERALSDLEQIFRGGQQSGEFRSFSPRVMAMTVRAAIDALPPALAANPTLNLDECAQELVGLFDRATTSGKPTRRER